jgi:hypothetical protein
MPPGDRTESGRKRRWEIISRTVAGWTASGQRPNRDTESGGERQKEPTPNLDGCQAMGWRAAARSCSVAVRATGCAPVSLVKRRPLRATRWDSPPSFCFRPTMMHQTT